ncbi:centrosomal protein of 83 kDa-like [Ptychodera flava]|uniref:centrosomal protein of 83 kDa-like n=1 Tax=Ptychodera flava TaxID=63121 RepID=UPI00396A5C00
MATSTTQIRHSSPEPESTNGGPEDLQKLLQNLEFENTQQLILIDKENQQIEALEKDLKHKQEAIQTLQESTAQLDEQTKRVHRQFKQNRENLGSLKKTSDVLVEHEEALVKKFERLKVAWETDKTEHEAATAHYESIWESCKNKYEDNPAARELAKQLNVLQDLEITADKASQTVEDLRCAIDIIKGKQEKPFESLTNWMISVAEVGKELGQTECEIQATQKNIIELQKTNEDLKDKEEKISEPSSRGDKGSKQQEEDESVMQGQDEGHQSSEVVDESTEGMDHHSNDLTHNLETEERCGLQPSQDATINNQQRQNSQIEMLRPSKPPPTRNHSVLGQVPQINIPRQQLPSRTHTEIQVPRLQTLSERSCYVAAPKQHCPSNRLSVNVPQLHVPAMNLGSPQHIRQQKPHQQSSSLLWQMQNQQLQRKLESFL